MIELAVMKTKPTQSRKTLKRAFQLVLIHLVFFTIIFSNQPFRFDGLHATIYDAIAGSLDMRFTYGLFGNPRAANSQVTFLVKYASGKTEEWAPGSQDNVTFFDKGHQAILRTWCDENIGDYALKTHPLLLRDAALFAMRTKQRPDDLIERVEIYKTSTSIPAPGSADRPKIIERLMLYSLNSNDIPDRAIGRQS